MNRNCTVLFLTPGFYPRIGGVETHVLKVSQELIKKGYKVMVVSEEPEYYRPSSEGGNKSDATDVNIEAEPKWHNRYISAKTAVDNDWIDNLKLNEVSKNNGRVYHSEPGNISEYLDITSNIIIYWIPKVKENRLKKLHIWLWFWRNRSIIKKADIIHCHDVFYWYLPFRFLFIGKPVYTTFHGYEQFPVPFKNIIVRKISERLSCGNICVGDFIKKWYKTKPDFVTYGGVDYKVKSPRFAEASRGSEKIKMKSLIHCRNNIIKILFIGRIEQDTGVGIYSKGLQLLKDRGIKYNFEAVGEGKMRNEFEKFGKVHGFIGAVDSYINNADIILASSYLSILQALAAGKPVVAVANNVLKSDYLQLAPFNNWIYIVYNEADTYKIVDHIIRNKHEYEEKLRIAQSWASEQTWEAVSNLYIKLWNIYDCAPQ